MLSASLNKTFPSFLSFPNDDNFCISELYEICHSRAIDRIKLTQSEDSSSQSEGNHHKLTVKSMLSQSNDLFNGQIKYYLKIYTFEMSLNLSYTSHYVSLIDDIFFQII